MSGNQEWKAYQFEITGSAVVYARSFDEAKEKAGRGMFEMQTSATVNNRRARLLRTCAFDDLTLEDAKAFLKISYDDDDNELASLLERAKVERSDFPMRSRVLLRLEELYRLRG